MKQECRFLPEKAKNEFHGSARFAYQMFDHAVLIQQRRKIKFGKGRELDENEKVRARNFSRFFDRKERKRFNHRPETEEKLNFG